MQAGQNAVEHFLDLLFRALGKSREGEVGISLFALWEKLQTERGFPGRSGDAQLFVQVGVDNQVGRVGLDNACRVEFGLVRGAGEQ